MSIAIYFTMATCLLPWMAYFLADWKMLCIATSVPLLLVVVTPWIVPESARYVISVMAELETLISINILKAKFLQILFKYSVLTAHKTHYISKKKTNQLILSRNVQQNSVNLTSCNLEMQIIWHLRRVIPRPEVLLFTRKKKLHQ
jgi:hypothetical protein